MNWIDTRSAYWSFFKLINYPSSYIYTGQIFLLNAHILTLKDQGVFLTLRTETKEARTIKLCTIIAYHIASISKQLKFLNSHCSIVCSYCSVVCLVAKMSEKMIEFSSSLKVNEIRMVDSPFNEDPENINFFQGGPNFGGKKAGKFRENGQ